MTVVVKINGLAKLKRAFDKSPEMFKSETRDFLVRAAAEVRRSIFNNPWRVGGTPGGVPVLTRNLQQSHRTIFEEFAAKIGPDQDVAPYARFVHDGTQRMEARPWLEHAEKESRSSINDLARDTLKRITDTLAG